MFLAAALVISVTTQTPAQTSNPLPIVGQLLTISNGYLVFTTGDAVKLDPALKVPANAYLGEAVRVLIDASSRTIVAIELAPRKLLPGDVDASKIPRDLVRATPGSTRSATVVEGAAGLGAHPVTVTINVSVPDNTPTPDDVYLATDRTNFSPAEIKMIRVDARTFTTAVQLAAGMQLRYDFSRGNFANVERDRLGGIVTPRALKAVDGLQTHDTVRQWADIN
jgi:hypothetical protein